MVDPAGHGEGLEALRQTVCDVPTATFDASVTFQVVSETNVVTCAAAACGRLSTIPAAVRKPTARIPTPRDVMYLTDRIANRRLLIAASLACRSPGAI
jgi:hypothetical protein